MEASEDDIRLRAGGALGAMCTVLSDEQLLQCRHLNIMDADSMTTEWTVMHGQSVTLAYALFDAHQRLLDMFGEEKLINTVQLYSTNDRVPIAVFGVHALGHLLLLSESESFPSTTSLLSTLVKSLSHASNDVKMAALQTLKHLSHRQCQAVLSTQNLQLIINDIVAMLRDRNNSVRALAEYTIAFLLQMDKSDELYDEFSSYPAIANTLQEYKRIAFAKISESLATEKDDYMFKT
jgi:hypothetical protein